MKKRNGYNIIELLVVIAAISLITAIAYKGVNILFTNIKAEQLSSQLRQIKVGMAKYYADTGTYPTRLSLLIQKDPDLSTGATNDEYDGISVAYYGVGKADANIKDYWAGPYVDGMKRQGDCIQATVGYEICLGAIYTGDITDSDPANLPAAGSVHITQLYKKKYDPTVGGQSIIEVPDSSKFYNVLSINGIESQMAIKLFANLNHRGIDVPHSNINRNNIISNKDIIGVGDPKSQEQTKTIVYRYTNAF